MPEEQLQAATSPDVAYTRRLVEEIRRRHAEDLQNRSGFAGCDCGDCVVIGQHVREWLPSEIANWLESLGLDPFVPVESWSAGDFCRTEVAVAFEYLAVGSAAEATASISGVAISTNCGNTTPSAGLEQSIPWLADRDVYSVACIITISPSLNRLAVRE